MANEYTLQEGRWSSRRLRAAVDDWADSASVPLLARSPVQNTAAGQWMWFFAEGSVRGCSLLLEPPRLMKPRSIRVRLNRMAGGADWQMAFSLMRALLAAGGGRATSPENQPMRRQALGDTEAAGEALARLREDAQVVARPLREGKPYVALPNPEFTLIVVPGLLSSERDEGRFAHALVEELVDMAQRYQAADRIPFVHLPDGTNFSVWNQADALVYLTRYLGVSRGEGVAEAVVLPGKQVLAALGDRVETVSEDHDRFYMPALKPGEPEDQAVIERFEQEGEPLEAWMQRFRQDRQSDAGLGSLLGLVSGSSR